MKPRLLLTGSSGFVGRAILDELLSRDEFELKVITRKAPSFKARPVNVELVDDLKSVQSWAQILDGIDVIIHAAGRAHVINELSVDPLNEFRKINVDVTLLLANQAAAMGVKRFIFISSIGVNGRYSTKPFDADDHVNPNEPYSLSKYEAELGLKKIAQETDLEVVIIRPPLVYSSCAPGNFHRLLSLVKRNILLPMGGIKNRKSFISIGNLVDFVVLCLTHPLAANQTFVVADGEDISTPQLIQLIAVGMSKKIYMLPVPIFLLRLGAIILGRKNVYHQLCCDLQVDISKAKRVLGWVPPESIRDSIIKAGKDFSQNKE